LSKARAAARSPLDLHGLRAGLEPLGQSPPTRHQITHDVEAFVADPYSIFEVTLFDV
jgi:hypothetical protein